MDAMVEFVIMYSHEENLDHKTVVDHFQYLSEKDRTIILESVPEIKKLKYHDKYTEAKDDILQKSME